MEHPDAIMRSAAHDIRGYLATASLATEHLSTHGDEQVARRAERIARAIDHVVRICRDDLVEPDGGALATHHSAAALQSLLEQIVVLIAPQFEDRFDHPAFRVSVASDVFLECHQTSLFRILYNLSVNAAHAIRAHSGSRVDLSVVRDDARIRFTVADDGPGLPEHIIDHLYPRIDRPAPHGMRIGHGLMTAVGLAKEMQGRLQLTRSGPDGTAFCLILPATL